MTLVENFVRDRSARTGTIQNEIVADDFAAQQSTAESRAEARGQALGVTSPSIRTPGRCPCDRRRPGRGGRANVLRRHSDFRDDGLAGKEQRLDDRTQAGSSACQQIGVTEILRHLAALLRDRYAAADNRSC